MVSNVPTVSAEEARILRTALVSIRSLAALRGGEFNIVWALAEKAINDESAENIVQLQRERRP